jgi:cbb3-type cytochrome oxidase subunit 1
MKIRANPSDAPHYQKLTLLAQLKASEAQIKSVDNTAKYTKWIAAFTIVVAIGTAAQVVLGALVYFTQRP